MCTKQEAKTIIISRFGMLECGRNFKMGISEICNSCHVLDDENHRLNDCSKYREYNGYNENEKSKFEDIFSNDIDTLRRIIPKIERVWDTRCAHGSMNKS